MKRFLKITCLMLAMLLALSLASCKSEAPAETEGAQKFESVEEKFVPKSAKELWEKINHTMDELESYTSKQTLESTMYVQGYVVEATATADIVVMKDAEYSKTEGTTRCEALSIDEKTTEVSAYYDGKAYVTNAAGEKEQKLCGEMTFEGYKDLEDTILMSEIDFSDCTGGEFGQKEDGSWEIVFSGYTKKAMGKMLNQMEISDGDLGAEIEDMRVEVTADEEFHCTAMQITFVFVEEEGSDVKPLFTAKDTFFDFGTASFDPAELKTEEYTQVDDLAVVFDLEKEIKTLQSAKKGSFTLNITNTVDIMGQKIPTLETDVVSYGVKNGAYYYQIAVTETEDGEEIKYNVTYEGGVQTVEADGESEKYSATQEEAKALIDSLLDPANYDKTVVTGVEKKEDGSLLIKVDELDVEGFQAAFEEGGITVTKASQEIYVTMGEEGLAKVQSLIRITGNVAIDGQREDVVILQESILEIQEREAAVDSSAAA